MSWHEVTFTTWAEIDDEKDPSADGLDVVVEPLIDVADNYGLDWVASSKKDETVKHIEKGDR